MSVRIVLDNVGAVFTNLDLISGKVLLSINREETFGGVTVKLECESRTRLAAPSNDRRDRYDNELEVHKLLYKTLLVFPNQDIINATPVGRGASYTLPAGQHEWPFQFKIPFNNVCAPVHSFFDGATGMTRDYNRHLKRPLPPTLSGFPGEAEIRYYIKVTAQRAAFYKENFRAIQNFVFLPIEPIRPPPNRREAYARRQFQFAPALAGSQKTGLFRRQSTSESGPPPSISIDGRLPDPPLVTCNQPLPLRILVKKLNETTEILFLKSFQLVLIGQTHIRAQELHRTENSSWVIVSKANLHIPLGNSSTPVNTDVELDNTMWNTTPLLNSICPTFETCNLSRSYQLEIRLGLQHGTTNELKPELSTQILLMPCTLYSGIKPPPALVEEMQNRQKPGGSMTGSPTERPPARKPAPTGMPSAHVEQSANINAGGPQASGPPQGPSQTVSIPDEPPPSYEDAMADTMNPVDGPRQQYEQPASAPVVGDEKRSSLFNR